MIPMLHLIMNQIRMIEKTWEQGIFASGRRRMYTTSFRFKIRMLVGYGKDDKNERHYYRHKTCSNDASDMAFDLSKFDNTHDGRTRDLKLSTSTK